MALDERYVLFVPFEQAFIDPDTGAPLANGKIFFFRDVARTIPKPVFQLTGAPPNYTYTSLGAEINLSGVGTVVNGSGENVGLYGFPYDGEENLDLYYMVVTREDGDLLSPVLVREAIPNITTSDDPTDGFFGVPNQISNPQFTRSFLNEGFATTFNVTGAMQQPFPIGPNWQILISGTGSVIVDRVSVSGNDNVVTSPPYVMDITVSAGITECLVTQRFNANSGLWASTNDDDIFLSGTFVARNENVGSTSIEMFYRESVGGSSVSIISANVTNTGYVEFKGATDNPIPSSTNTSSGDSGFVDIFLSIAAGAHVRLSSVQVIPTFNANEDLQAYDLQSSNREQALQGSYFIPELEDRRVDTILTGWDFTINPSQLGENGTITSIAEYCWDQTIAKATQNINFSRNTTTEGLNLQTTGTGPHAVYVAQYLEGWPQNIDWSVNLNAYKSASDNPVTARVYLLRGTSGSSYPTLPAELGTLSQDGTFTVTQAGWSEIARSNLDVARGNLPVLNTVSDRSISNDLRFSEWEITDAAQLGDGSKFAIVVTFTYQDSGVNIILDSISVTPSKLPSRPLSRSTEKSLWECRFFYEKSYNVGTIPGTPTTDNSILKVGGLVDTGGNLELRPFNFQIEYQTTKRISNPTITIYSPSTGNSNEIFGRIFDAGVLVNSGNIVGFNANWTQENIGSDRARYIVNSNANLLSQPAIANNPFSDIQFQYTIDARLGK